MKPVVEYLPDDSIDDVMDQELRGLLTACFTKSTDTVFKTQRYFREPYPHRWVIRNRQHKLIAHIGVHEKEIRTGGRTFRIGGICEVCVHPDYRGRGYMKSILNCIHAWLAEDDFTFSVLFGNPRVYGSSGYVRIDNLVHGSEIEGWKPVKAMIREVSSTPWPDGKVQLPGPRF